MSIKQSTPMIETHEIISQFESISLGEMDGVRLMNRCDRKYWFHASRTAELLSAVTQDYYVVEVERQRCLPYSTTYYDTAQNEMFSAHHRGKLNRYKIRRRCYKATQSSFLEVKFKSNKGRTIKSRHPSDYANLAFDLWDREFIEHNTPYSCDDLQQVLENSFRRLTLVSKGMDERCTIDIDLRFVCGDLELGLQEIVVVEVKSEGHSRSAIIDAMCRLRIKPSAFSKFCVGRSLLHTELKQNLFKTKRRLLDRVTNNLI